MMVRTVFLRIVLLLAAALASGCASRALIVDRHSLKEEAILFDTIRLDPNHLHGVYIKSIDNLNPYAEQTLFRRFYGDESRNSLAWVIPAGARKLDLVFHDSATILGRTARARSTVIVEMAAQGLYAPETVIVGDEIEWRIIDKRSGTTRLGPWRTVLDRGFTFSLSPHINPAAD